MVEIIYEEELNWDLKKYNYLNELQDLKIFECKYPLKLNVKGTTKYLSTIIDANIRENNSKLELQLFFTNQEFVKIKITLLSNENITEYDLKYFYLDYIKGALFDLRDKDKQKFTIRNYRVMHNTSSLKSSCKVNGKNKFIFGPLFEMDRDEPLTEHILYFDIEVEAKNIDKARTIAYNRTSELSTYLSVVFDVGIADYRSGYNHFIERTSKDVRTRRLRTGFVDNDLSLVVKNNFSDLATLGDALKNNRSGFINYSTVQEPTEVITERVGSSESVNEIFMKHRLYKVKMKKEALSEDFDLNAVHYPGKEIKIPNFIGTFFKGIDALSENNKSTYIYLRNACRLYNLSLIVYRFSPSSHIAYLVAAIEALSKSEEKSFSEFVRYYVKDADNAFLDFLYGNVRSGHFHSGQFPFMEYDVEINNPIDTRLFEGRNDLLKAKSLLRNTFANWIKVHLIK
ncbi:hypothetical protein [Bacillus wiedmannii]|uniref:Uncharacterized protein n=1 Tax=Bacillus wiedmannii TaxID=1890302 RepID=A0A1C4FD06_9BACI|nr:hypothetical protein [Bacillus wiedmannii]SCC53724.1 Putative uncharacterized protein [Bacillus wiedmannii]